MACSSITISISLMRLKEKDFAGERGRARAIERGDRVQARFMHLPQYGHGDEVVHQLVYSTASVSPAVCSHELPRADGVGN